MPRTRLKAKLAQDILSLVVHSTAAWLTSGVAFYDKLKQIATRTHTHTHATHTRRTQGDECSQEWLIRKLRSAVYEGITMLAAARAIITPSRRMERGETCEGASCEHQHDHQAGWLPWPGRRST